MDLSIFRKYDIRGIYPNQINEGVIYKISSQFDKIYKKGSTIVVGYDARIHSRQLYESLKMGLLVAGMKILSVDLITTPMLSFVIKKSNADGGVMVTASHNPARFNGLKVSNSFANAIGGLDILKKIGKKNILSVVSVANMISVTQRSGKKKNNYIDKYVDFILGKFNLSGKIKIVVDASQGSAGPIVEKMSDKNDNIDFYLLNTKPDGTFYVHGPDPDIPYATKMASNYVVQENADLGVVFDADGDRAIFIDELGNRVRPEYIWRLLMVYIKSSSCVYDISSIFLMKKLLNELMEKNGVNIDGYESKVGRLFLQGAIKKHKSEIGFEYSGHYYFEKFWGVDSGIITMVYMINALSTLPYSFSKFIKMLPQTTRAQEIEIDCEGISIKDVYSRIKNKYKKRVCKISMLDGISVNLDNSWFNLRKSNTQNIIRLNIESETEKGIDKIKKDLKSII